MISQFVFGLLMIQLVPSLSLAQSANTGDFTIPMVNVTMHIDPATQAACAKGQKSIPGRVLYEANLGDDPQEEVYDAELTFPCSGGTQTAPAVKFSDIMKGKKGTLTDLNFLNIGDGDDQIQCSMNPAGYDAEDLGKAGAEIDVSADCKLVQ